MKIFKISQTKIAQQEDFGGYFTGQVPDYAPQYIGTSSVEASQIAGSFGRANEALQLVNQFSGDVLKNIAFIFNFAKGGAYGVYVPALDRAIKTKALRGILENKGYTVTEENGMVRAYAKEGEKKPEEIDEEIKKEWEKLSGQGGTAIGINMADILSSSSQNASKIMNDLRSSASGNEIPQEVQSILQNILAVYNLASTIVHESAHTKGGDEGAAESAEGAFVNWSQNRKNEQYKRELSSSGLEEFYTPLTQTNEKIHAKSSNWYKTAQYFNQVPGSILGKPRGSDLEGRHGNGAKTEGMGDWGMMMQKDHHMSIEKSLGREHMFPINPTINQDNQVLEEQLRRNTPTFGMPDARLIMEELLTSFHDETASYQTMEELLEDTRPKPLMKPIRSQTKTASLIKEATLFGWFNNLEVSDGSTIPGLGDRVMAWDDRDECFSQEEDWIDAQPRYNPEYDLKGFYYNYVEPRFKPQLWDDMVNEDTANVHPAKRFGKTASNLDPEMVKIINILGSIQRGISEGATKATRLIVSEDISPMIEKFFGGKDGIATKKFIVGETNKKENINSIWIFRHDVSEKNINSAEEYFQNKNATTEVKEISEKILGTKEKQYKAIQEIVSAAKDICKEYDIKSLYLIGSYARELMMGNKFPDVNELDFRSGACPINIKIGSLLAKKLGINNAKTYKNTMTFSFVYKGVRVDFEGDVDISEISSNKDIGYFEENEKIDLTDSIISDICNRDFTVNMMVYDVVNEKLEDKLGIKSDFETKILKTYFDPEIVISKNPMIILRAIKMKLKYGFEIEKNLQIAMIRNSLMLFDGRYSEGKLIFARESVRDGNSDEADRMFDEFNISKIKELGK